MKVPIDELGRELKKNMDKQARAFQKVTTGPSTVPQAWLRTN